MEVIALINTKPQKMTKLKLKKDLDNVKTRLEQIEELLKIKSKQVEFFDKDRYDNQVKKFCDKQGYFTGEKNRQIYTRY